MMKQRIVNKRIKRCVQLQSPFKTKDFAIKMSRSEGTVSIEVSLNKHGRLLCATATPSIELNLEKDKALFNHLKIRG